MKIFCALAFLLLSCASVKCATKEGWELIWWDEFDGTEINKTKWSHEVNCWGGGNNELQCYTARPQNSRVENGNLVIQALQERYTGSRDGCTMNQGCTDTKDYTSARLRTINDPSGSWKYGRWEVRAILPNGKHLWPALWMLPTDYSYGLWAASGEMDIMEYRGQETNKVSSAMHYGGVYPRNTYVTTGPLTFTTDFSADYHLFAFEWEENEMRYYVDNTLTWKVDLNKRWCSGSASDCPYTANKQPWDKRFHFLINLAIGGAFFNGYGSLSAAEARQWKNSKFVIDYIRAYKKVEVPSTTGSTSGGGAVSTSGSSTGSNNCCNNCCCNGQQASNIQGQEYSAEVSSQTGSKANSVENQLQQFTTIAVGCTIVSAATVIIGVVSVAAMLKKQQSLLGL